MKDDTREQSIKLQIEQFKSAYFDCTANIDLNKAKMKRIEKHIERLENKLN